MLLLSRVRGQPLFTLAFGADHLDDLPAAGDEIGQQPGRLVGQRAGSGLIASAKWAMTAASIGSVLARCPSALAKARTCAGLTTTTGSPPPPALAATTVSKPPVASIATSAVRASQPRHQPLQSGRIAFDRECLSTRDAQRRRGDLSKRRCQR